MDLTESPEMIRRAGAVPATFRPLHPAKVLCSATHSERDPTQHVHELNSKSMRETMFGLMMVLALVVVTVASPVSVMAVARAKSRRK
jgi:hypothetical protein